MATLQIENLPDDLYQSIQTIAAAKSVSLNDTIIQLLTQATHPGNSPHQPAQTHPLAKSLTPEKLKNALLEAIERADPNYVPAVAEALTEAMSMPTDTPSMDADEFREWLAQV